MDQPSNKCRCNPWRGSSVRHEILCETSPFLRHRSPNIWLTARRVHVLIEIREERPNDVAAVRDLNRRAFGQDQESNIVDALRANGAALLSLVATVNDRVVGHIMYSP